MFAVLFPVVHVCDGGALFQRYLDSGHLLGEEALGPDHVLYQGEWAWQRAGRVGKPSDSQCLCTFDFNYYP